MNSCIGLLQDRIDNARIRTHECEVNHLQALVKQEGLLQKYSEKELLLWQALYKLNNEAFSRGSDLITAQTTVAMAQTVSSAVYAQGMNALNSSRRAGLDLEKQIGKTSGELHKVVTCGMMLRSRTVQLGMAAQQAQQNLQGMLEDMSRLIQRQQRQ